MLGLPHCATALVCSAVVGSGKVGGVLVPLLMLPTDALPPPGDAAPGRVTVLCTGAALSSFFCFGSNIASRLPKGRSACQAESESHTGLSQRAALVCAGTSCLAHIHRNHRCTRASLS